MMRWREGWLTAACLLIGLMAGTASAASTDRVVLKRSLPVYPELAKKMHVCGAIRLTVSILPNGEVNDVELVSGHPLLVEAAKDAVRHWKFASGAQTTTEFIVVEFELKP